MCCSLFSLSPFIRNSSFALNIYRVSIDRLDIDRFARISECSKNFLKVFRNTMVVESCFSKAAGVNSAILPK